jgi:uncharacterized protein
MPGNVGSMSADLPPSTLPLSTTQRTTLQRLRERGRTERAELYAVLDAGLICHLGVLTGGSPVVLPPSGVAIPGHISALAGRSRGA